MNLKLQRIRAKSYIVYFIMPAMLVIFIFFILPNISNFIYSFTDWTTYRLEVNFTGLENFRELSKEGRLWKNLFITLRYAVLITVIENVLAFILALALEKSSRFNGILRTIFFIPVLISPLAAGYIFRAILSKDGILNQFLSLITGLDVRVSLLGSTKFALLMIALVHAWKWFGVSLVIYIAGLNSIPEELIEAARIEGANPFQILKNIKIPLIGPSFTFNISLGFIGGLSIFDIVLVTTRGGPGRVTEVLNMFVLHQFATGRYGQATAISLTLFLVILFIGIPLIIFLRKREIEL